MKSIVAKPEPASWKLVTPFDSDSCAASSITRRRSASMSAAERCAAARARTRPARPCAVSRSRPVGSPLASFTISPPGGFGVARVIPASSRARRFTNAAWPLACVRYTGLSGDTESSDACTGTPSTLGSGTRSHFS
jgi:hypothetical protein